MLTTGAKMAAEEIAWVDTITLDQAEEAQDAELVAAYKFSARTKISDPAA